MLRDCDQQKTRGIKHKNSIRRQIFYLYKSLFSINKLNQNLVSFACSHCGAREGWRRYGFVSFSKEVCVPSSEYVFEGSFKSFIYSIVIVFCIETSNVSLYRIDFTGVMNRLWPVSKRLVSKRLCIETTGFLRNSAFKTRSLSKKQLFFIPSKVLLIKKNVKVREKNRAKKFKNESSPNFFSCLSFSEKKNLGWQVQKY